MNSDPEIPPPAAPAPVQPRLNVRLLLACLLGPALFSCLAALLDKTSGIGPPAVALIGAALGGVGSGILLGRRYGHGPLDKVLLGVVFAGTCGVAVLTMATFGCLAGRYSPSFH